MTSMPNYRDLEYKDLQALCKKYELGGKGSRDVLITKLVEHDLDHGLDPAPLKGKLTDATQVEAIPEQAELPPKLKARKGPKATDPNPDNPNWDLAGRWIRRPSPKRRNPKIPPGMTG